ncbi:MAG: DUF4982 domain-containing protein [Sedimentisphaerales bacterium]|nr:DUF4982 domain-containing protein [Sedimentisphaerales bacterium]
MTSSKHSRLSFLLVICFLTSSHATAQNRQIIPFDSGWKFISGDQENAQEAKFDDSTWRNLNLPHDWSIEGPFLQNAPSGGGGGYAPTGIGWYRKHFTIQKNTKEHIWIEFDGVFENSSIWLNGKFLGKRPYGYISFHYDLTEHLLNDENVIAVKADNSNQPNSRWYSGSGIYRHVRLVKTNALHIAHWGTYITAPEVSEESASVSIITTIVNEDTTPMKSVILRTILLDNNGNEAGKSESKVTIEPMTHRDIEQKTEIKSPKLWSIENPNLYSVRSEIAINNSLLDDYITTVGIRKIEYDVNRGFLLNNKHVKMHGVNLHHNGGSVGAAVPKHVWKRRLEILKEMGCNAIRTSHNPPAPEFLDLCDELGFLVMDEAFDEWTIGKVANGYNKYFAEWSERDLTDFIRRDRNHPSVVMWSVGNEVREQPRPDGFEVLRKLADIAHREDITRPITQGCDNIAADGGSTTQEFLELLDIVGYNYVDRWHERRELFFSIDRHENPDWKMIGTESANIYGVRDSYSLGRNENTVQANYTSSMIRVEQLWKFVHLYDYVIGDFMWTGIDYLGESFWPGRGASSGVLDTCGFTKDSYYFYQSQWTDKPMIHIFPHWNWPGREGQFIPVLAYTNCDTVELYLNDKLIGIKSLEFPRQGNSGSWMRYANPVVNAATADLHLSWDVPYEPGVLKAIGKKNNRVVCTEEVRTAGDASAIRLIPDSNSISTNRDIAHVRVEIVDSKGLVVPAANNLVTFNVKGQGKIIAVDNGNTQDLDSFQARQRRAFNGLCLVVLESDKQGTIELTAESEGLKTAAIKIVVQPENMSL